jgi:hypothetical protein
MVSGTSRGQIIQFVHLVRTIAGNLMCVRPGWTERGICPFVVPATNWYLLVENHPDLTILNFIG